MTRIMPPRIPPGIGGPGRFGGIRGGDFRQRLTGLAARLPAVPAFRPDAVLQRALQTLKAPGAVQRFLQTGRAAFEALQKKYPLKDPGRLPTLPFQPPEKIRIMLPTYPPRYIEVQPRLRPKLEDSMKAFRPLPKEIQKIIDEALRRLQKRFPSPEPAFRSPENLLSSLRDFMTEVGRHVPPMGTGVPSIPASELHQHGPLLADPVVGSGAGVVLKKPVSDIDARGPLLAAATEPHLQTLSQTTGVNQTAQAQAKKVEQTDPLKFWRSKASDWWKDPVNFWYVLSAASAEPTPGWDFGHIVSAFRAIDQINKGDKYLIDRALNFLANILLPLKISVPWSLQGLFAFVDASLVYRDVRKIAILIQEYRKDHPNAPPEKVAEHVMKNFVLQLPEIGWYDDRGSLRPNESLDDRFARALAVYYLATGDEGLTGVPQR